MNTGSVGTHTRRLGRRVGWSALVVLLAALLVAASFWMFRRISREPAAVPRRSGMTAPSTPFMTVEQAEQRRRQQIAGRMEDPAYREQLDAVASRRQ